MLKNAPERAMLLLQRGVRLMLTSLLLAAPSQAFADNAPLEKQSLFRRAWDMAEADELQNIALSQGRVERYGKTLLVWEDEESGVAYRDWNFSPPDAEGNSATYRYLGSTPSFDVVEQQPGHDTPYYLLFPIPRMSAPIEVFTSTDLAYLSPSGNRLIVVGNQHSDKVFPLKVYRFDTGVVAMACAPLIPQDVNVAPNPSPQMPSNLPAFRLTVIEFTDEVVEVQVSRRPPFDKSYSRSVVDVRTMRFERSDHTNWHYAKNTQPIDGLICDFKPQPHLEGRRINVWSTITR